MNRLASLLLALAGTILPASALCQPDETAPVEEFAYSNYADDFVRLIEETEDIDAHIRAQFILERLQSLFPGFYGADRYREQSDDIEAIHQFQIRRTRRAIERHDVIGDEYRLKLDRFVTDLPSNVARFRSRFPDFAPPDNLIVLHSLGEMDGGTRSLDGQSFLIFGIDGMVEFHEFDDDTAFFQHELFHAYHSEYFAGCAELWCEVWREGLAGLVSHRLVPNASEAELLLDWPSGTAAATRASLAPSLLHLTKNTDSKHREVYSALLQTSVDETGLPPRRGYYLGYLIAQEAERSFSLQELAHIGPSDAKAVFDDALEKLIVAERLPRFITMSGEWSSRAVRSEPASFLTENPSLTVPHRIVAMPMEEHAGISFTVLQAAPAGTQTSAIFYVYDREANRSFGVFANADGSTSRGVIEHRGDVDHLTIIDANGEVTWHETKTWISDEAFLSEGHLVVDGSPVRVWYRTERASKE